MPAGSRRYEKIHRCALGTPLGTRRVRYPEEEKPQGPQRKSRCGALGYKGKPHLCEGRGTQESKAKMLG
jgi:hypothetical protein